MTPLHWQDSPVHPPVTGTANASAALPPSLGFILGLFGGAAFSLGLVGLVLGVSIARSFSGAAPAQVALAPSAAAPSAPAQPPPPPPPAGDLPAVDPKTDHIRGDISKAKVAVVEYSDFECPFCKRHHPTMKQVMDTYKNDVVWVYRHFPLSFHANAAKEAEASECANELGGNDAFWKYTDKIFEKTTSNGTGFPLDQLAPLAKELGLNEAKFKSCLDSGKYAKHVQDEMDVGAAAGVQGTPGNFVVNLKTNENRPVSGAVPFATFKSAIDAMLGS